MNTDRKDQSHISLGRAFACAFSGIWHAIRSQRNMKIHLVIAVLAVLLGFVLRIDTLSWVAIVICIALVLGAECINTAIESFVDLASPEPSEFAARAKDCSAGAVLICAIGSVVVGIVIFLPRICTLFGWL